MALGLFLGFGVAKAGATNNLTPAQVQSMQSVIQSILAQIQTLLSQLNQIQQNNNAMPYAHQDTCRTKYLDKLGEAGNILIYQTANYGNYKVYKCDLQTNTEIELKLLGYTDDINVVIDLSPNGKYLTKTSFSSKTQLPKIELMSLDDTDKLTVLARGEEDLHMKMIWSDDSARIAYWTCPREISAYPPFKLYYLANIIGAEPKLIRTYNDMTHQGAINLKKLVSSENKLYLETAKITDGAPAHWRQEIIEL
ncbi:MAG TPA: hypothetical protein PLA19_02540 [Candidatus Pacearchaeota archaeon]|nr:hypothetical protein [Candidatus Pacearchaeota archaeon]